MSKLPGNAGLSLLGDKSLDFYRDPVSFYRQKMDKHGGRVFQSRLLNRPTAFICSVEGMRELLSEKSNLFLKDPTDLMTNMYGDTIVTTNGEEACLLRLSLTSLFTGRCLESQRDFISSVCERCLKDLSLSGQPECVYSVFKRLGTELVLGLFLNVRAEEQPELFQEIMQLCTQHWHGLISAPVNVKVPLWSSGFSTALEARDKLMDIIKDKLENDKEGFVGSLGSLPLPDSSAASQHLLLFISALIPKAVASLLTSFTLVLGGNEQEETRRRAGEDPDYLHRVLLEVQRLWPPFIGGRRIADQDSTLAGFHVPKGNGVIYISHGVHRDPEVFEEPDNFQPERWRGRNAGQEHLLCSFGSGPRSCIGSKLADIFLKDVCMYLLKHYDWCLDPPSQDLEYKWLPVSRPADPPTVSFTRLDQTRSDESDTS
ncbi:cytochrome P450 120 isoform X1 [Solea senegalensis]|uniref:Cytochrome P450 120 isoform X1 n=1 Tax=Solea senegalensis TaxID=28829 RepID=A0AAV6R1N1_SOLSE|nr:putative cytochrome P450 120 isoform X2 [Solea senegalensis]KAG7498978.1 cytochrome P450 120 isoform X1 [Solea senegalensis]